MKIDHYARVGFNVSYEERVSPSELRLQRIEKVKTELKKAGLDALLVWKDENQRYLTDLRPQIIHGKSTCLNGALLVENEEPILFCSGGERDRIDRTMPWIKEVHTIPIIEEKALIHGLVKDILGPVLKKYKLDKAKIGLDESNIIFHKTLEEHFPNLSIEDGDTPMQKARMIKLPGEIVMLEEATAIADAVCATAINSVQEGVRECDVAANAMHTLYTLGGEYSHVTTPFVASGEHMAPPNRICSDKIIRDGDLVFIDIGAAWNGYFGDMARTVYCGTQASSPSKEQINVYSAVYYGLQAGINEMRPGKTNKDSANALINEASKFGLGGRFLSLFIGHGVGIGANEPPYIGETLPGAPEYEFEPGMVFAVEPLIWIDGVRGGGGVRLEEMVLVTEDGPHIMSRTPFDERLITDK